MDFETGKSLRPLEWAVKACDTLINKFEPRQLPPAGEWHYHQGVFLLGMKMVWEKTGHDGYFQYIKDWVDCIIKEDGSFDFERTELDSIQAGMLLFDLYDKTGDGRYRLAADTLISLLPGWKKTSDGGLWHKDRYPNQMWLDGLYMAGPFAVRYGSIRGDSRWFERVTYQALLMYAHTHDEASGLLYHAWDENGLTPWSNPVTKQSPEFWGRSMGWYLAALIDILDYLPGTHPDRDRLIGILQGLAEAVAKFQDKAAGLWYQVLDKGYDPNNWLETSCSSLFVYALGKAAAKGYISGNYTDVVKKGYWGILEKVHPGDGGSIEISDICIGTGVGDYAHYLARPRSVNDLHGAGAFIFACMAMEELL